MRKNFGAKPYLYPQPVMIIGTYNIAETLEADTFEITPAEIYTLDDLDWRNENSRVNREHDDPCLRTIELISAAADKWDSYGVMFIGYP